MTHDMVVARTTGEGRANRDKWGYTVHEDFLSVPELAELRERLEEQAELERNGSHAYGSNRRGPEFAAAVGVLGQ